MKSRVFGVRRPSKAHARWINRMAARHLVRRRYIHFGQEISRKADLKKFENARQPSKTKATARVSRAVALMMRGALEMGAYARWSALRSYNFAF
ncbi:hypothetical protein [Paraburkholderia caffeinilytica]|uniref:hypothetical protein n=1 Tax=Paraburkholderia caffeinilytica TaxID=1761016 RepID=UPI003DA0C358